jgi:hypothetical protein
MPRNSWSAEGACRGNEDVYLVCEVMDREDGLRKMNSETSYVNEKDLRFLRLHEPT